MYELNLKNRYGTYGLFSKVDFEKNDQIRNDLEEINDFEKRLLYYNDNVQSLSIHFHEIQIYFEWHYDKPPLKIYCNCKNCDKAKEFSEYEKIFFKLRNKEVKRIIEALEKAPTYKEKLQLIFSIKGYYPDRVPAIYPNMAKSEPLYLAKAFIDLTPANHDERIIYNQFVKAEFESIAYDENGDFTKEYYGFNFEKERERLDNTLKNGHDKEGLLILIKNKIEKAFNYPECRDIEEKEKNKHIISDINKNIDDQTICRNIFANLILGIEIDINRIVLNTQELKDYTHHTQIFRYYLYVKDLIEENEPQSQPENMKEQKDIINLIIERTKLHDFLSVPAPDISHQNAFWHDENNNPIDCNIYHPKYGYNGFEANNMDKPVLTSFQTVTAYQDERSGKYIYCQYHLQMLCTSNEIDFSNKDGEIVTKVDYLQTNRTRLAANEQDFELIYRRELKINKLNETPEIKTILCKELAVHIQELIRLHETSSSYKNGRDIKVLTLANRFIKYLTQIENEKKQDKNDFLLSAIEDKLKEFQSEFNREEDYNEVIKLLKSFFLNEKINIINPFFIRSGNVKKLAFALGEIWRTQRNEPINYEYLGLYKLLFSIFTKHEIEKSNVFGCSLYKYSISKT